MQVVHDEEGLAPYRAGVLVPTMGALHEGHAALIRRAGEVARPGEALVVSVFVNPTQFNERDDFEQYPRDLERDLASARALGADCVFTPPVDVVYPPGRSKPPPDLPAVATAPALEDAHRPGHFAGVCQVVHRLLELAAPRAAIFGEKDWQQLQVVRAVVEQERLGVEVIGYPTVREADGLALSSRNALLDAPARRRAAAISRALAEAAAAPTPADAESLIARRLREAEIAVEYAAVRDAQTLLPPPAGATAASLDRPARALAAGRVDGVRLIDNMPWPAA